MQSILTDGLDGLATVPVILVAGCFAFISYVTGNIVFSEYLNIPYLEGSGRGSLFFVDQLLELVWGFYGLMRHLQKYLWVTQDL